MPAYYNEIDPQAAQWLRNLIAAGLIAPGDVDCRSILEVQPSELAGYTQCHFFAGIGVWSHALRSAGWPDDRPVWTGSCPCQPFSTAGKGGEFDDERHLWPTWFRLIRERRPSVVFGEQVASKVGLAWIDHVSTDLEGENYTFGAVDTCAAGVGAPHIRQRFFFVAHAGGGSLRGGDEHRGDAGAPEEVPGEVRQQWLRPDLGPGDRGVDHPDSARRDDAGEHGGGSPLLAARPLEPGSAGLLGDPAGSRSQGRGESNVPGARGRGEGRGAAGPGEAPDPLAHARGAGQTEISGDHGEVPGGAEGARRAEHGAALPGRRSAVNGFWAGAEWLPCRDGKARPVEPGTFPLAHGAPARLVRLRAYGNAIVAPVAEEFIRAYLDVSAA